MPSHAVHVHELTVAHSKKTVYIVHVAHIDAVLTDTITDTAPH